MDEVMYHCKVCNSKGFDWTIRGCSFCDGTENGESYNDNFEYEDMPSNEQRLDYLDNPYQRMVSVKDFNGVKLQRSFHAKKTAARLLQSSSEENEVSVGRPIGE